MANIKHTTLLFTDLSKMQEIPSEYLEPYLVTFMSYIIESVGCGWKTPQEAKNEFKGVYHFVSLFGGIHSRIAISNEFGRIENIPDEEFIQICKKVCEAA